MKKFNINMKVYFHLTECGMEVWRKYFNKYPTEGYTFEDHLKSYTTKDGYNYMQLHLFMNIFENDEYCIEGMSLYMKEEDFYPEKY